VLSSEDPEQFELLRRSMIARLNPRDPLELRLVQQMIAAQWKLDRLHAAEQYLFQTRAREMDSESRSKLERILQSARNEVSCAQSQLSQRDTAQNRLDVESFCKNVLRCETELEEWRPVSSGKVVADLMKSKTPSLERLQRYMQKLELSFQRALRQLRELQKVQAEVEPNEFAQALLEDQELEDESDETKPPQAQTPAAPEDAVSPTHVVIPSGTPRGILEAHNVLEHRDPPTNTSRDDTRVLPIEQGRANGVTGSA
jgi:hypothetical protein